MTSINWSNITDLAQLPAQANTVSNGTFWIGVLYMLFVIMLLVMIYWGFEIALLTSGFLGLILALVLVYSDLIPWYHVATFAGILLVMFLYIIYSGSRRQ